MRVPYDPLDFISSWGYGFCFGTAVREFSTPICQRGPDHLLIGLSHIKRGIDCGEIGFKKVGDVAANTYVAALDTEPEIKDALFLLHRGIHMKQKQYILKAYADLEHFVSSAKLSSGDGKKNQD